MIRQTRGHGDAGTRRAGEHEVNSPDLLPAGTVHNADSFGIIAP